MKKLCLALLSTFTMSVFAQIEVDQNGNVGVKTTSAISEALEVNGDILADYLKLNTGSLQISVPISPSGWARGVNYYNPGSFNAPKLGGIGMYGTGSNLNSIYIGFGNTPWDTTNGLHLLPDGDVGIGTTTPQAKFHLFNQSSTGFYDTYASSIIEGQDARLQLMSSNAGNNGSAISLTNVSSSWTLLHKTSAQNNRFDIGYRVSSNREDISDLQSTYVSILNNGNVGIGTTDTFNHKLAVDGAVTARDSISASEFNVYMAPTSINTTGNPWASRNNLKGKKLQNQYVWADYVFEEDYDLKSLKEVEKHIEEKGHLPNIPSAEEVYKKGSFSLGEMNIKLLEKVEELTLYLIDQNKKLEKQEERIKALEKELKKRKK